MAINAWELATEYVNSLGGLRPLLIIMHGPWVSGEAYVMEPKPPLSIIIIANDTSVGIKETEVGGLRIVARFLTPDLALSLVKQGDEELINAVYSGSFLVKDEEYYRLLEDTINGEIRSGRLTWDSKRGVWVKATLR
ncbi:hypothetical protein [Caldivirga sp.]|uniref:hypothetical protein n=1 Tax=Caldivirga sp. TaxID=2080243 RepID=UPI0025B840E0|nr:hypothetical protein [Caldivirga sp.]